MGMGRRERDRQDVSFAAAQQPPMSQGHAFSKRLNKQDIRRGGLLSEAGFDREAEELCGPCYQPTGPRGRPSIPPGPVHLETWLPDADGGLVRGPFS